MNLLERLHEKMEVFRLERRYTCQRQQRTTFVSKAKYVNGEYIFSPSKSKQPHNFKAKINDAVEAGRQEYRGKISSRLAKINWGLKRETLSATKKLQERVREARRRK
ncbi:hypothetical protein OnM2_035058 [Erysiphe neolycopersici]|uniref:Uncharacterized protein n=1 Tax=Erysiphe neolycopersici TaxID=212602 RepID=A0A420HXG4_9PEZI|nr:hypothetical protein OnM2_035058 [Erysiphe neolycopersici]